MRTKRVVINVFINFFVQIVNVFLALYVRRFFSQVLGDEILGLNSLYASIMGMLLLSELGLDVAVAMCLFKPLAEDNKDKICAYMCWLKKAYFNVGCFMFLAGLCVTPFLGALTKSGFSKFYLFSTFELYVLGVAVSYFWSYKKTLLFADQRNYIISASQLIYKIGLNVIQYVVLFLSHNYYYFLIVIIVCNITENYVVSKICDYYYPFLKKNKAELKKDEIRSIKSNTVGLLGYKLSGMLIEGTDNMVISFFLGTAMVAYYSNYYLIVNMLFAIFANFATSSIAGLGNMLYTEKDRLMITFSKILLIQHFLYSFSGAAFLVLSMNFVSLVFPSSKGISFVSVMIMSIIYVVKGYSQAAEGLRNAAAKYEDKYKNIIIGFANIIISAILVQFIGIVGVLVGTLICYLLREFVVLPRVNNKILSNFASWYYRQTVFYLMVLVIIWSEAIIVQHYFLNDIGLVSFVLNGINCFIFSLSINIIIFRKKTEFVELCSMIKRKLGIVK